MAALGIRREDRKAVLDHSEGDVHGRHYDQYERLPEKRLALAAWERRLRDILGGGSMVNVLPITKAR
jgi:hypothetical protein